MPSRSAVTVSVEKDMRDAANEYTRALGITTLRKSDANLFLELWGRLLEDPVYVAHKILDYEQKKVEREIEELEEEEKDRGESILDSITFTPVVTR